MLILSFLHIVLCLPTLVASFVSFRPRYSNACGGSSTSHPSSSAVLLNAQQTSVLIDSTLDDDKVTSLFAWVSLAFAGRPEYNNLMLAIAAVFGNLPENSLPVQMVKRAMELLPDEEELVGDAFSIQEREDNSLGAMGAAQWTGRFKTRPHALLELHNITTVDDWVRSLPRGCRRTIQRSLNQNFTVTTKIIRGDQPAPHSSLAHFRCVVAHEVRLLSNMYGEDAFLDALAEAVSRYIGTTRMAGEIREYRNATTGRVIAIAHEVCTIVFLCRGIRHYGLPHVWMDESIQMKMKTSCES